MAGFSMTLNAVYGITQALHWTSKWDYWINLSASDLPLLATASEALRLARLLARSALRAAVVLVFVFSLLPMHLCCRR